jgi:maltose alpha-D-glucosyltransferase / alpha-amylase
MLNSWYKTSIIYGLDVKTFYDSNNDGIGDIRGLIQKLDYLVSLGIDCLWLLPFHPSPKKDNGYDVSDYYSIDPELGSMGDFIQLLHEAKIRGLRIIIDLVVNHTSVEHPWFQESKKSEDSRYREFYIWTKNPKPNQKKIMFEGIEDSIWEYCEITESYYLHRYFKHQADLNMANPEVRKEIINIMDFWLKLGVDGFRVDSAHIITDPIDVDHIDFGNLHEFLDEMRDFMNSYYPHAILLGEANVPKDRLKLYFENDNRMHMLFNFILNKHIFLGIASGKGDDIYKGLESIKMVKLGHWVNFVRHHDELNLELLNEKEKNIVFNAFAPDEEMRLFGHGIRRRLAPMVNGSFPMQKLFYSLIFSLPGTPLINFGEEIGMGDDLSLYERESVRTPMQWSPDEHGGFSKAPRSHHYRPVINKGDYGYEKINVREQQKDPESFLNWMAMLIRIRRQNSLIGLGEWNLVKTDSEAICAITYMCETSTLLIVHNLSDKEVTFSFSPEDYEPLKMADIFTDSLYELYINQQKITLNPYGFRWIDVIERKETKEADPKNYKKDLNRAGSSN